MSIAVRGHLVYVLNAGGDGSVRGYRLYEGRLDRIPLSTRTLGLGNDNPPFFLTSPGQVGFTPDGSRLIVTTKASTSSIDVFTSSQVGVSAGDRSRPVRHTGAVRIGRPAGQARRSSRRPPVR